MRPLLPPAGIEINVWPILALVAVAVSGWPSIRSDVAGKGVWPGLYRFVKESQARYGERFTSLAAYAAAEAVSRINSCVPFWRWPPPNASTLVSTVLSKV